MVVVRTYTTFPRPNALIVYDPVTYALYVVTTKTYTTLDWRETVNRNCKLPALLSSDVITFADGLVALKLLL
jgi:hypothetical protein